MNWRMENQWTVVNRAKLIPKFFPRFRNNGPDYVLCLGQGLRNVNVITDTIQRSYRDVIKTLLLDWGLLYSGGLAV